MQIRDAVETCIAPMISKHDARRFGAKNSLYSLLRSLNRMLPRRYELTDHLGNVRATISDRKLSTLTGTTPGSFRAELLSASDYYPFGSLMPGRNFNANGYRFGFNGMEKDDEISGTGNHYTTFFRELDVRLGHWWAVDPKTSSTPWESPYISMGGNPIKNIDPFGDKWKDKVSKNEAKAAQADINEAINNVRVYSPADGKERIAELKRAKKELKAMGKDKDYTFTLTTNSDGEQVTIVDPENNKNITMTYDMGEGLIKDGGIRLHELKHGYQAMTGDINYHQITGVFSYDQYDELAAFKRQYSLRGVLDIAGTGIRIFNYSSLNVNHVNDMNDGKSYLYRHLPQIQIRTNSTILQRGENNILLDYSDFKFKKL